MPYLKIDQGKVDDAKRLQEICPFGAIDAIDGEIRIGAGCRLCRLCLQDSSGAITWQEDEQTVDNDSWQGIAVFAEFSEGRLHPVTLELLGKARQLADRSAQDGRIWAVLLGMGADADEFAACAEELRHYGVDQVVCYQDEALRHFRIEPYTAALQDFVEQYRPSIFLIGATVLGRSLAPRLAARFRTGLTADCTLLDIAANGDLVQIRPAFGGNIMAQIKTPRHRPQFATVRYKVFSTPPRRPEASGEIIQRRLSERQKESALQIRSAELKPKLKELSEAEVIVVAGRGIKAPRDLQMLQELADRLGGMMAATRPLIEAGWAEPHLQIGLSGRTVSPKLLITAGVSGAIQFVAGIGGAECVVAINSDPEATIFQAADIGLVGDLYEIVPVLLRELSHAPSRI